MSAFYLQPETSRIDVRRDSAPTRRRRPFVALRLENFKQTGRQEIAFDGEPVAVGRAGHPRSQVFDAMRLLHGIAEGRDATSAPATWFGAEWETSVAVSFNTVEAGVLTYSVTLQRIDDRRVRVLEERVEGRTGTLLLRRRHSFSLGATDGRYGVGAQEFALYGATKILADGDPVRELAAGLRNLWLLNPDPNAMKGAVGFAAVRTDDASLSDLASCIAMQQARPEVARALADAVCRLNPDVRRYAVERNGGGVPYLAIYRKSDLDDKGTSFGMLGNREKMLFLVAFVCTMNEHSAPVSVVWDSPFNWLGENERTEVSNYLRRSFSRRSQLLMLT